MTLRPLVMLLLIALIGAAQPDGASHLPELRERLLALTPDDPEAYYLLGEEIAAESFDRESVELARTLFVLAAELERRSGSEPLVGAGACIALADLARLEQDRRWLAALARAIDPRYALPSWASGSAPIGDSVAHRAAETLGLIRAGHTPVALRALEDPEVRAVLERYEMVLSPTNEPGAFERLLRKADQWPCPECDMARITFLRTGDGLSPLLCGTCSGDPGPALTESELIAHLRLESRLLEGIHMSWAAQYAADLGAPLRDPDPSELAPTFGVDPNRPYWRGGGWVSAEEADRLGE